jgi:ubiquinone/menaquinone biosynthesis C-methylase UbiE
MQEVRKEYDLEASEYDEKWGHYVEVTVGETLQRLKPFLVSGHVTILDVGCGTGALFHYMRQYVENELTMIGVDISEGMLDVARKKVPQASFVNGSASHDGIPDVKNGSVDLAVSVNSFHFWPDPISGLKEIREKLKPGGRVVITDWNHEYWWCKLLGVWLWVRRFPGSTFYSRSAAVEMLHLAGFRNISGEPFAARGWGMFFITGEK